MQRDQLSAIKEPSDIYRTLFVESSLVFLFLHGDRLKRTRRYPSWGRRRTARSRVHAPRPYQETEVTSRTFIGSVYLPRVHIPSISRAICRILWTTRWNLADRSIGERLVREIVSSSLGTRRDALVLLFATREAITRYVEILITIWRTEYLTRFFSLTSRLTVTSGYDVDLRKSDRERLYLLAIKIF